LFGLCVGAFSCLGSNIFLLFARVNKVSNTYVLSVELLSLAELLSFVDVQNLNTLHSLTDMHAQFEFKLERQSLDYGTFN
jgi:hypothetical protein